MSLFRRFLKKNQRLSYLIRRRLPPAWVGEDLKLVQDRLIPELLEGLSDPTVVDIGGGRNCYFAKQLKPQARIIAVDVSLEELANNEDVACRVVADAVKGLPFAADSVDVVASRSVVEHLQNVERYFSEANRCLRPNGYFVNVFPCRYSPFSVINRMIPNSVARRILFYFHPYYKEDCGFLAYYDRLYYSKIRDLLDRNGFDIVDIKLRYYQSVYYDFFLPFYVISLSYDLLMYFLGIRNLAAQLSFVARKRG